MIEIADDVLSFFSGLFRKRGVNIALYDTAPITYDVAHNVISKIGQYIKQAQRQLREEEDEACCYIF